MGLTFYFDAIIYIYIAMQMFFCGAVLRMNDLLYKRAIFEES